MDNPKCDICGKPQFFLYTLSEIYHTEDIKKICTDCNYETTKQLRKLHDITFKMNEHWLKKFMTNLKETFEKLTPK